MPWFRSCGVALVLDEMLQRAAWNMNSSKWCWVFDKMSERATEENEVHED
jgi:hypothetical protein